MDLPTLPETELIDPDKAEILASFRALPTEDDLPCDDGEPMETPRYREQMNLLIDSLKVHWADPTRLTERSGNKTWVHWRWQCPTFLRQTFVEWAAESIRHSFWARLYSQQQREKGKSHQAAVRALAFKWIRVLFRCWQHRAPYD